jgi:hypothetical protein
MAAERVVSLAGIENKEVSWRCERDDVEVDAVHPVQISHLKVGTEQQQGGRQTRIIKLEMQGAELMVFRQSVRPSDGGGPGDA